MKDRLMGLLDGLDEIFVGVPYISPNGIESIAEFLINNGVIVPPCKVGDTVYVTVERLRMPRGVYQGIIKSIILTEEQVFVITKLLNNSEVATLIQDIFPSKEEAEQALSKSVTDTNVGDKLKGGAE